MNNDETLEPKPSDDFPSMADVVIEKFDMDKDTTPLPYPPLDTDIGCTVEYEVPNTPENLPPNGIPNLDITVPEDFSFGGSAKEVAEAVRRNEELVENGFKLSNTEEEHLRPKLYGEDDVQLNSIACDVDLGDDTPRIDLDLKGWDSFGERPIGASELPTKVVPRKDDSEHWKRLYFAQKGITAQLEKIIEEML